MKRVLALIMILWASQAAAQLLHGVTDSLSGGGTPIPPAGCTNGNLLLDYSDPCQLMSQMVGN